MASIRKTPWQKRIISERQQLVREFIASNDPDLGNSFIDQVQAPNGYGLFASTGPNYQYAVFGRDSIEAAEDLVATHPELAKEIMFTMAHFQGQTYSHSNEEEPGKLHHEYRSVRWGGRLAPPAALKVFGEIAPKWGGDEHEMRYYGSFDASVLFVRLVHRYCQLYGLAILSQEIVGYAHTRQTLHHHVRKATLWFAERITASPWGLFEYKRLNPDGISHQAWEDSEQAYLHTDGSHVNAKDGVAAVELQAYAYDALLAAADIAAVTPDEANAWRQLAKSLQAKAVESLWMDDTKYFAMGLDRADDSALRQIQTLNSNAGLLLDSRLLLDLPENKRKTKIEHIVRQLFSEDFLTPAGLRVRAKRHLSLVDFADYHGASVSWPKQTYDVAKGLRRHGYAVLADLLEACILHAVTEAGEFYEFFLVSPENVAKYHYRQESPNEPTFHAFGAANTPEPGQAWTISAVLAIVARQHHMADQAVPEPNTIEREILEQESVKAVADAIGFALPGQPQ